MSFPDQMKKSFAQLLHSCRLFTRSTFRDSLETNTLCIAVTSLYNLKAQRYMTTLEIPKCYIAAEQSIALGIRASLISRT
jgi:hypothetical protein